jgi:hypothetical protein
LWFISNELKLDYFCLSSSSSFLILTQAQIEDLLRNGSSICFHVRTTSMLPLLRPNDEVIVKGVTTQQVESGMVLILRREQDWVVHRLLKRKRQADGTWQLITKGDNLLYEDPVWSGIYTVGVVTALCKRGRITYLNFWRTRLGGRVVAWISALQARLSTPQQGLLRSYLLHGLHKLLNICVKIVYGV